MIFRSCAIVALLVVVANAPAAARPTTFASSVVSATVPRGAVGEDAGVDVRGGRYIRLSASGSIHFGTFSACPRSVGPDGCAAAFSFSRIAASAPTGVLLAAFADGAGRLVTAWAPVGRSAYVAIPPSASRLLLRVNGTTGREYGGYHVSADVVSLASAATDATSSGPVHRLATLRQVSGATPTTRASVQHLLRRFAFSGSPADVNAVLAMGQSAWLAAQLAPATVDDSQITQYVQPLAGYTGNSATDIFVVPNILRRIVQREVASKRQVLEKLTLHWIEHFSVGYDKVLSPGAFARYEDVLRSDALGNFATLASDVAKEPAMLRWLDNNYNDGSNPSVSPPNENFARELMQLFIMGENKLNLDGSPVLDAAGVPVPAYSEGDVRAISLALTGMQTYVPSNFYTISDPRLYEQLSFNPSRHAKGPYTILGTQVADPGDVTVFDRVIALLAHNPSTAPFEAKELLQRFVTEDPSPGYIARIATVWAANVDDPNQIAKVVAAVVADPEFATSRYSMVKEPIEFSADAVRALGGETFNPVTTAVPWPLNSVQAEDSNMGEPHWNPETVFSFYRPGEKDSLLTNSELLVRWSSSASISNSARISGTCSTCSLNLNLSAFSKMSGHDMMQTLVDALVDGGTPELRSLVENYIANDPNRISGAIWIVLTSPEYEAN